jgi:heat shock protein HtpX
VVAVTTGLLKTLDRDELAGVLGHELGHVQNRDILISALAAVMAGAISYLASMAKWALIFGGGRSNDDERGDAGSSIFLIILAPIAAMVVQMAVSRSREFLADEAGARISGRPMSLARALQKLEMMAQQVPMDASPATAHLFIVNPLTGGGLFKLFSTHPSTQDRVEALQQLAMQMGSGR